MYAYIWVIAAFAYPVQAFIYRERVGRRVGIKGEDARNKKIIIIKKLSVEDFIIVTCHSVRTARFLTGAQTPFRVHGLAFTLGDQAINHPLLSYE